MQVKRASDGTVFTNPQETDSRRVKPESKLPLGISSVADSFQNVTTSNTMSSGEEPNSSNADNLRYRQQISRSNNESRSDNENHLSQPFDSQQTASKDRNTNGYNNLKQPNPDPRLNANNLKQTGSDERKEGNNLRQD